MKSLERHARHLVILMGLLILAAGVSACGKNEIPEKLRGKFKVPRFVLGNVTVEVQANAFVTPDCVVNCGVKTLPLTTIKCEPVFGPTKCKYTSEHCTGTVELERDKYSITATVVPGATGEMIATRNMTCAQISGNNLERLK